ncbi:hypothetical protein [Paenibacillus sp. OV219]|uniref:hypothetical protein n=1 Tax=Paenibacillus sp. OV219 TaxID=1884377 RepID=UPI0008BAAB33|nr:hypothetical protein [Paenibacillus sp. OV219]SEO88329.1 hypothetical protein SAMN05518847_11238 [Paenibacillus sp. OV219]
MRLIYENYRGFQIYKYDDSYNAVAPNLKFNHNQLSQLLNKVDLYLDSQVLHIAT